MLSGDDESVAVNVGRELGLDEVHAELLPEDKVEKLEELRRGRILAFVGDGINDAPVLSRADVGIAMGGLGSDAAIEAADVVIMDDNLSKLSRGIRVARKTRRIVSPEHHLCIRGEITVHAPGALWHLRDLAGCICRCRRYIACHLKFSPHTAPVVLGREGTFPPLFSQSLDKRDSSA